ncbi:MAG: response regulator [Pseudorhizobium sp.]
MPSPVASRGLPVEADGRSLAVLAVDDDALVLMNTVLMLEDLGHVVDKASSAQEALEMLQRGLLPDVLVTDHVMPHMTGAELAKEVKRR